MSSMIWGISTRCLKWPSEVKINLVEDVITWPNLNLESIYSSKCSILGNGEGNCDGNKAGNEQDQNRCELGILV